MRTFTVHAFDEFDSAHLAIQDMHVSGLGDVAISLDGRFFTVEQAELERLQRAGVPVTIWHDVRGKLMSVPC